MLFTPAEWLGVDSDGTRSIVKIRFTPFAYNPVTRQLMLTEEVGVRIEYQIQGNVFTEATAEETFEDVSQLSSIHCISSLQQFDGAMEPTASSQLLIVCSEQMVTTIQPYVFWKTCLGYDVETVSVETITQNSPGMDLAEQIRNFLLELGL